MTEPQTGAGQGTEDAPSSRQASWSADEPPEDELAEAGEDGDEENGEDEDQYLWPAAPDGAPGAWQLAEPLGRWAGRRRALGPAAGVAYAEFGVRAAAFAIDFAIYMTVSTFVIQRLSSWLQDIVTGHGTDTSASAAFTYYGVLGLAVGVALLLLYGYMLTVLRGTPGQLALGLSTLRGGDGRAAGPLDAFVRVLLLYGPLVLVVFYPATVFDPGSLGAFIGDLLPTLLLVWYVLLALAAFADRRGRGLHDYLAGTVVVREVGEV